MTLRPMDGILIKEATADRSDVIKDIILPVKITYSLVGRKLGESSLVRMISLHLLMVSNSEKVSPTLKMVARQRASSLRVGGPGFPLICPTS